MPVSDDGSYFSRFLVKFVEIIAAGLATAVSGYLIAHFSGALSSPPPAPTGAVIQVAPSAVSKSLPAQPIVPNSADSNGHRLAPAQAANAAGVAQPAPSQEEVDAPPVAQPARSVNAAKSAPLRKHIETTTSAAESKRDQQSFVARVRAALGSGDRTESLEVSPQQSAFSRGAAPMPSPPVADPSGAVAVAPVGAAALRPAPMQHAPTAPNPSTVIEIEPRPVPAIQSAPAPSPAKDDGVLSGLDQILRRDPLAGSEDAPRPPLPVGQ
jgi:DNA polymerase III gamma/tau subunit